MLLQHEIILRLTASQHDQLKRTLFAGDGKESVAVALCGTHRSAQRTVLCVHRINAVPDENCTERSAVSVVWPTEPHVPLFSEVARKKMVVLKIHSHPSGFARFSGLDDTADRALLGSLRKLAPNEIGHASAVMLPEGKIFARLLGGEGRFSKIARVVVVGDEIVSFEDGRSTKGAPFDEAFLRTQQAFGAKTVSMLSKMRVGVVGCSGTGSWVVEMLSRLGVGELVLVDPDVIERKNLNRILNSVATDAAVERPKVKVFARAIRRLGLGTKVTSYQTDILQRKVVQSLAGCDFLFGCVDSADGRDALNRVAAFYIIPYVDVGVLLQADGKGSVQQVCAAVHYLIPDGSSLLSRRVITAEQVRAESLRRRSPDQYAALRKEGYIQGVNVDSPAVISINGFAASHAVNEMLARIHPFRRDANSEFRAQTFSLSDGAWLRIEDGPACPFLSKRTGRGDCEPMLDNSELS
ncbi:MAG TPA: ThiF family adenylyltransferase [Lacipirellulaceae bacterium]|nr:ThiF family adenylyltransferase [Lacipirellulaceae bacterium]